MRWSRPPRYAPLVDEAADTPLVTIESDGAPMQIRLRRTPRARRVSLRTDARTGDVVLVLPERASLRAALGFARSQAGWIRTRLAQTPPATPFAPGAVLDILGARVRIAHDPALHGATRRTGDVLLVGGRPEFVARRVRDHLRAEARRILSARAREKAAAMGAQVTALRVADTRSRWGSCARGGRLSFSWRLVMAPPEIVDYVVAHEVAHIAHHDHGDAFWAQVDRLTPHRVHAQAWLRREGPALLRAGAT